MKPILFNPKERAWLTDAAGNRVLDQHHEPIAVCTDQYTGLRYQRVAARLTGSPKQQVAQQEVLAAAGAVHFSSENSNLAGWWAPVNESAPGAEPLAAAPSNLKPQAPSGLAGVAER